MLLMPTAIRAVTEQTEQTYNLEPLGAGESQYGLFQHPRAPPLIVWRVPVGCDYSGFFVEVLNFLIGLQSFAGRNNDVISLDMGKCSEEFLRTLEPEEADLIRRLQRTMMCKVWNAEPDWKNYHFDSP